MDLTVSALTAPATAGAGSAFSVTDTTKNQGTGNSAGSTTRFYLSTNFLLDGPDVPLGSRTVPPLAAGASDTATTSLTMPAGTATGTYYVIALADGDNAVTETAETNNTDKSATLKIGGDLVLTAVSAPATAAAGTAISVTQTTEKSGIGIGSGIVDWILSVCQHRRRADRHISRKWTCGRTRAGETATRSMSLQIPADTVSGSYYVIGVADWNNVVAETVETNNTKASGIIKIGGDLVVTVCRRPARGRLTV